MHLESFKYNQLSEFFKHIRVKNEDSMELVQIVSKIVAKVKADGDQALLDYTSKFDQVTLNSQEMVVQTSEFENLVIEDKVTSAIKTAIDNITAFHRLQKREPLTYQGKYGEKLSQRITSMDRAGVYIPGGRGGKTPLISSALMNIIPAKLAGVKEIIAVTPPRADKTINPNLLYAFQQCGVTKIIKAGGAQAIAALAYGTEHVPACDIIVGPGNAYVTAAKRLVFGDVMIDGVFGPSEVVVVADESANPKYLAADLISQAEHAGDEMSALITNSDALAQEVQKYIALHLEKLSRKEQIANSFRQRGAVLLLDDLKLASKVVNQIAPEHLELVMKDPSTLLEEITHAGAIFVGENAPEPIGDYICGTNHVLPTNGAAKFTSPLGTYTFEKISNVIEYSKDAFNAYAPYAETLAEIEGLDAHKFSLTIRHS